MKTNLDLIHECLNIMKLDDASTNSAFRELLLEDMGNAEKFSIILSVICRLAAMNPYFRKELLIVLLSL